jgi:hypothetical protein
MGDTPKPPAGESLLHLFVSYHSYEGGERESREAGFAASFGRSVQPPWAPNHGGSIGEMGDTPKPPAGEILLHLLCRSSFPRSLSPRRRESMRAGSAASFERSVQPPWSASLGGSISEVVGHPQTLGNRASPEHLTCFSVVPACRGLMRPRL